MTWALLDKRLILSGHRLRKELGTGAVNGGHKPLCLQERKYWVDQGCHSPLLLNAPDPFSKV